MIEKTIQINSTDINFKQFTGNKENILILHGWGGSSDSWVKVGELLSEKGYNVYIPDLPGFGKTTINKVYDVKLYAETARDFLKKLNLGEVILIGHSNGGRISIHLSSNNMIDIKKLILIGSAGIKRELTTVQKIFKSLAKKGKRVLGNCSTIRSIFYKLIGGNDYLNCNNPLIKETFKNVLGSDLRDEMSRINVPTDLIWGSKDTYTPLEDGKKINKLIKGSSLTILKGEKHGIHLHSPDKLTSTILKLIE